MNNLIIIIFGMAAVTYGPRLMPFLVLSNREIPEKLDTFLKCIPAAAIGMVFTLIVGLWKGGIIIPVLGAVMVTWLTLTSGL